MKLMIGVYESPGGYLLLDCTPYATSPHWTQNEHGDEALTCIVPRRLSDIFRIYSGQLAWVQVSFGARVVWAGRLERPGIQAGAAGSGLKITAHGPWATLSDAPYTALWSDTSTTNWQPVLTTQVSSALKDRFVIDTNNRLFLSPKLNSVQGGGLVAGMLGYTVPSGSARQFVACDFAYTTNLPANYTCRLDRFDANWTYLSSVWTLAATGATLSGLQTLTFAACDNIAFQIYYSLGSATHTGQDGDFYLRLTNMRVKTTTSAVVYADEIAKALIAATNAVNPTQLSSSVALIQSPGLDLTDEVYEDQYPSDILTKLASLGDNLTPPRRWVAGVDRQRRVFFWPKGTNARTWYINVTNISLERAFDQLANSAYGVYQDANSRTLRTATVNDATSSNRTGLTRRVAVGAQTTSAATAGVIRDAALADKATARPQAQIVFDALYADTGRRARMWEPSPGDTLVLQNIPTTLRGDLDALRSFRLTHTDYDPVANTLAVEPEGPLATLEVLLARREKGF